MQTIARRAFLLLILLAIALFAAQQPAASAKDAGAPSLFLPLVLTPDLGPNFLPNPSFEAGWYHPGGVAELQIPAQWQFSYREGPNALDPDPWNAWVRPEARVLSTDFLPPVEHDLFVWNGRQTVKIFKGYGAISFDLTTQVTLPPGRYLLQIYLFPDLVVGYKDGQKVWAPDLLSGEVKLIAGSGTTGWMLPIFGQKNRYRAIFTLTDTQTVRLGAAMRGRWAIQNNGWFLDDWGLYKLE